MRQRWGSSLGGCCWGWITICVNNLSWPNYSLFSLCLTELLLRVDEQASNGTWEEKKKEEKQERRGGGEGENQFSQTEAGWSNGGLKEEEEERTYFPLITSCSLSGKPWKLASLQQPHSSDLFAEGMESSCFFRSVAIRLWGGECSLKNPNMQNDKEMAINRA